MSDLEHFIQKFSNPKLQTRIREYLKWDQNEETRNIVLDWVKEGNQKELEKALLSRLTFGTAGLRAEMGPGFSRMNLLTVLQATQGLCLYLLSLFGQEVCQKRGVVIGYDHRHHSYKFALISASVFISKNIPVYLFRKQVHTPIVPYSVLYLKSLCGVMITASHNPKQDNGYKLYWENGCQVNSPHDEAIHRLMIENSEPWQWQLEEVLLNPKCHVPSLSLEDSYYQSISKLIPSFSSNITDVPRAVYTAMHGVGYLPVQRLLQQCGLPPVIPIEEQMYPDPDFWSVQSPNPENQPMAFERCLKLANHIKGNVKFLFATDPDADRFTAAELENDRIRYLDANQIAMLFADYLYQNKKYENVAMITTCVSSKFLKHFCEKKNICYKETLTGFKYMSNEALSLQQEGYEVLFAYEEAIGFMTNSLVRDKDGVSALCLFYRLALQLYAEGKTLLKRIEELFDEFGHFYFNSHSLKTNESAALFSTIRNHGQYLKEFADLKVKGVYDVTKGVCSGTGKKLFPETKGEMIILYLQHDSGIEGVLTIRQSGTEPKVKFYMECWGSSKQQLEQNIHYDFIWQKWLPQFLQSVTNDQQIFSLLLNSFVVMGRRKISIQSIQNDRLKAVTFSRRKMGLIKKAHELSVLCHCKVMILMKDPQQQYHIYGSEDPRAMSEKYLSGNYRKVPGCSPILTNLELPKSPITKEIKKEESQQEYARPLFSSASLQQDTLPPLYPTLYPSYSHMEEEKYTPYVYDTAMPMVEKKAPTKPIFHFNHSQYYQTPLWMPDIWMPTGEQRLYVHPQTDLVEHSVGEKSKIGGLAL